MPNFPHLFLRLFLLLLLLLALAAFTLFAFNGLVIPMWHSWATHESVYQTPHAGYFVGALVLMVLSALVVWLCWRGLQKLSPLRLNHPAT